MKLRILNNYIRLRLSQSEVESLEKEKRAWGKTVFTNVNFHYSLEIRETEEDISADFENNHLKVLVSSNLASSWIHSEKVSMENKNQQELRILVEKDFKCLHKRPGEDETDNFPNPLAE